MVPASDRFALQFAVGDVAVARRSRDRAAQHAGAAVGETDRLRLESDGGGRSAPVSSNESGSARKWRLADPTRRFNVRRVPPPSMCPRTHAIHRRAEAAWCGQLWAGRTRRSEHGDREQRKTCASLREGVSNPSARTPWLPNEAEGKRQKAKTRSLALLGSRPGAGSAPLLTPSRSAVRS